LIEENGVSDREGNRDNAQEGPGCARRKRSGEASEGLVGSYIHAGGKIRRVPCGEMNASSGFRGAPDAFRSFAYIAMHIAALAPRYVRERRSAGRRELEKNATSIMASACGRASRKRSSRKSSTGRGPVLDAPLPSNGHLHQGRERNHRTDESPGVQLGENFDRRFVRFKVGKLTGQAASRHARGPQPFPPSTL